jgi:hypothetical protein
MRGNVWRIVAALAAAAWTALPAAPAAAQVDGRGGPPRFRYSLEGYVSQYRLDQQLGTNKSSLGGFGLRLVYNRDTPDRESTTILDRADGSLFATYTTKQGSPDLSTLHVGLQTDFAILPTPLGGRLDPFVGLSIGVFRTSREDIVTRRGRVNRSDLAVSPGAGLRIPFLDGVGARGDVRVPLVFGTTTTANVVAEAGLYFSF